MIISANKPMRANWIPTMKKNALNNGNGVWINDAMPLKRKYNASAALIAPKKNIMIPAPPKKCMGFVENFVKNFTVKRSKTTRNVRVIPYFVFPRFLSL